MNRESVYVLSHSAVACLQKKRRERLIVKWSYQGDGE